jgi:phosphoglycerate kinase
VIILTHLGEPKPGKFDKKYSVKPVAEHLSKLLNKKIKLINNYNEFKTGTVVGRMKEGDVAMLENVRFESGETDNGQEFCARLSKLADIYVNDAFAVSHRNHASVSGIKRYLPAYAGFLLELELTSLNKILQPQQPLVLIMGGSKISTKATLVKNLSPKAYKILIGGALANNFLAAKGYEVGNSLIDVDSIKFAQKLKAKNIVLPVDVIVASSLSGRNEQIKSINEVGKNYYILDIGPKTIKLFADFIKKANTLVWNGPLGMYENKKFKYGTQTIATLIGSRAAGRAFGVVGGGETIDAVKESKIVDEMDWVSTGGGAMLSYLGGEEMPGIKGLVK